MTKLSDRIPKEPLLLKMMYEFKIITKTYNNTHCSKGGSHTIAQIQPTKGDVIPAEVKDNKDGSYSASFTIKQVGKMKLSVTIEEQYVKDSPYNFVVFQITVT